VVAIIAMTANALPLNMLTSSEWLAAIDAASLFLISRTAAQPARSR